jgi:hypothetical protein
MQTPPPFHGYEGQPPAPMKKKNNTVLIIFAILGALLLCCGLPIGVIGFYGMKGLRGAMQIGGCVANVNMMKQALHDYAKDHDGKLPSAKNWQADLGKYLVSSKDMEGAPIKFWKAGGEWSCEDSGVKTGFMFNEALSEKKVADVTKANPDAIAIFETKTVAFNQSGPFVKLPYAESPKMMGELLDERRGWLLIDADGTTAYTYDKNGKMKPFDANMKGGKKNGLDINFNSDSSDDSKDEKSDNSN